MKPYEQSSTQQSSAQSVGYDAGLREHMLGVYQNLAIGLALSAVTALMTNMIPGALQFIYSSPLGMVVQLAPIGILFYLMFTMKNKSSAQLKTWYYAFCAIKGVSLAYIAVLYAGSDIFRALGLTAAIFGAVSLYGYSTKRDLTSIGFFMMTGVFAIFFVSIGSMLIGWIAGFDTSGFQYILFSGLALLLIGLTAYETQQLKAQFYQLSGEARDKAAVMTTLSLYINVIIVFQWILSLMGGRE